MGGPSKANTDSRGHVRAASQKTASVIAVEKPATWRRSPIHRIVQRTASKQKQQRKKPATWCHPIEHTEQVGLTVAGKLPMTNEGALYLCAPSLLPRAGAHPQHGEGAPQPRSGKGL